MTRYLVTKHDVNLIGPKTASDQKDVRIYMKAYKYLFTDYIDSPDQNSYWFRASVMASYMMVKDKIDGVIFTRDKYCTAKIEEIDLLQSVIQKDNIPNIVIDYRYESKTTVETVVDTFVEMLKWKKGLE